MKWLLTKSVITIFSCNVCKICASPSLAMSLLDMFSRCTVVLLCKNQRKKLNRYKHSQQQIYCSSLCEKFYFFVFVYEKIFQHFLLLSIHYMRIWIWAGSFIFCFHSMVKTFFFIFINILLFCNILRQWF